MTIEMDKIFIRIPKFGEKLPQKHSTSKQRGLNRWLPDKSIEKFSYIIINPSKVQSYHIGIVGSQMVGIRPGEKITIEGNHDLIFERSTAKLISKGIILVEIINLDKEKSEPIIKEEELISKPEKPKLLCECGRKLSPRNKTGVCLYCRKNNN